MNFNLTEEEQLTFTARYDTKIRGGLIGSASVPIADLLMAINPDPSPPKILMGEDIEKEQQKKLIESVEHVLSEVDKTELPIYIKERLHSLLSSTIEPFHDTWIQLTNEDGTLAGKLHVIFNFVPNFTPEFLTPAEQQRRLTNQERQAAIMEKERNAKIKDMRNAFKEKTSTIFHKPMHLNKSSSSLNTALENVIEKRFFGATIAEAISNSKYNVPDVCADTVEYLVENATEVEGLFRIAGSKDKILQIKQSYEDGNPLELDDIHDTAGLLKLYLRELADPLVPFHTYQGFIAIEEIKQTPEEEKSALYSAMVNSVLPDINRLLLKFLCQFLWLISQNSEINKMEASNLAIVFAPNILRPEEEDPFSMIKEMPMQIACMEFFIAHCNEIFSEDDGVRMLPELKKKHKKKISRTQSSKTSGSYSPNSSAYSPKLNPPSTSIFGEPPKGKPLQKKYSLPAKKMSKVPVQTSHKKYPSFDVPPSYRSRNMTAMPAKKVPSPRNRMATQHLSNRPKGNVWQSPKRGSPRELSPHRRGPPREPSPQRRPAPSLPTHSPPTTKRSLKHTIPVRKPHKPPKPARTMPSDNPPPSRFRGENPPPSRSRVLQKTSSYDRSISPRSTSPASRSPGRSPRSLPKRREKPAPKSKPKAKPQGMTKGGVASRINKFSGNQNWPPPPPNK